MYLDQNLTRQKRKIHKVKALLSKPHTHQRQLSKKSKLHTHQRQPSQRIIQLVDPFKSFSPFVITQKGVFHIISYTFSISLLVTFFTSSELFFILYPSYFFIMPISTLSSPTVTILIGSLTNL